MKHEIFIKAANNSQIEITHGTDFGFGDDLATWETHFIFLFLMPY